MEARRGSNIPFHGQSNIPMQDKKEDLHKSESVSAFKRFGRRLMHPTPDATTNARPVLDSQTGSPIRAGNSPTSSGRGDLLKKSHTSSSPNRLRAGSGSLTRNPNEASTGNLSGRLRANSGSRKKLDPKSAEANFTRGPVSTTKSSVALNDLIKHSHNPFVQDNHQPKHGGPQPLQRRTSGGPGNNVSALGGGSAIAGRRDAHTHHAVVNRSTNMLNKSNSIHNNENANTTAKRTASKSNLNVDTQMVYNPYGMNPNLRRPDTAYIDTLKEHKDDVSFYMHDGNEKIRMLPLPIEDPNKFLPEEMKQFSISLTDNFVFDSNNKPIGSGGSSEVRKIRSAYKSKDVYALKKLNMIYHETPEKFYKRCSKEFIIAKSLSHNIHITKTFYLLKVPTTTYTTRGWGFVMELGVKDLFELMERSGWKYVPLNEKYCLFKQVAEGIKFCHENGIAHRDLKPENVLLSKDGVCKLTDFGISDWIHKDPKDINSPFKTTEGMIGSPPYTPPEVMFWDAKKHYPESLQKPYDPLKMDPYALGIMLITMVNNIIPFLDSCNTDLRFREYESSYENFIAHGNPNFRTKGVHKPGPGSEYSLAKQFKSTEASRVAWRLADPKPETRYTMEDLFNDPWFQSIETCVHPLDIDEVHEPELRKATTIDGIVYANSKYADKTIETSSGQVGATYEEVPRKDETSTLHHSTDHLPASPTIKIDTDDAESFKSAASSLSRVPTENTFKPRSMVEIAEHPLSKEEQLVKQEEIRQEHARQVEEQEQKTHEEHQIPHHENVKFSLDDDAESIDTSNLDSVMEKPVPSSAAAIASHAKIPGMNSDDGSSIHSSSRSATHSPTRNMTELSLGDTPRPKKKVVHNHFDIPHSAIGNRPSMISLFSK